MVYRSFRLDDIDRFGMLYIRSDGHPGSSGSGVYTPILATRRGRRQVRRRLLAVFIGNRVLRDRYGRHWGRYNAATGITLQLLRQICRWAAELCRVPDWYDREGVNLGAIECKEVAKETTSPLPARTTVGPSTGGEAEGGSGQDEGSESGPTP